MRDFQLDSPVDKPQTLQLLAAADDDTRLLAGGTGLLNLLKQRLASPGRLISLHRVTDLGGITLDGTTVTIGALERLIDIGEHPLIGERLPVLRDTLAEVASPRIRMMATLGGAVAHGDPNQDTPVALMALDAIVVAESRDGVTELPIAGFYRDYYETRLSPDQLVTAVRIPGDWHSSRFSHKKFTPGSREDYACVGVCVRLDFDDRNRCTDSRIVLGSVGPTVFRSRAAEELLAGKAITENLARQAAQIAANETDPVDDTRGSADYKRRMAGVWVRRCLLEAAGP